MHTSARARSTALHARMHTPGPPRPAQCFSNFALYLKGREELVVTIHHGLQSPCQTPPIARVGSIGCGPCGRHGRGRGRLRGRADLPAIAAHPLLQQLGTAAGAATSRPAAGLR